mmetsp:Transcript_10119/g.12278  ORF Transcript_10119/g.12278 Transcript_10119/m.12278 type:complete len:88 (+) Transcript_10119:7-270(+)
MPSCQEAKSALWACVLSSPCGAEAYSNKRKFPEENKSPEAFAAKLNSCLQERNGGGSDECAPLRLVYFECIHEQLNMRNRIRGPRKS